MSQVLLIHDGELADCRALLEALGAPYCERRGPPNSGDLATAWRVVVGTPRRVMELQVGAAGEKPTRIALIDGDSRTLLAMLRRSGIDLMVQRPVHPSALRLLILHAMYRGPEKRRHQRITIGAPVRFRCGLRKRPAMLADLSLRGCRLIAQHAVRRDQTLRVHFGHELGCDRAFTLKGKVVRSGPTEGAGPGAQAVAVAFDAVTRDQARWLKQVLRKHASGPATIDAGAAAQARPRPAARTLRTRSTHAADPASPTPPTERANAAAHSDRTNHAGGGAAAPPAASAPGEACAPPASAADRHAQPRHELDRRVIALGVEATRVLIGRDISTGGMRVERNDTLSMGDRLRLALHVRARSEPLVLDARVERDDDEGDQVLSFVDLGEAAQSYLRKMVNILPILAARGGDEGSGVIVSEILERRAADAA